MGKQRLSGKTRLAQSEVEPVPFVLVDTACCGSCVPSHLFLSTRATHQARATGSARQSQERLNHIIA
jgi:alkylhydroperoxidase family enzyme